MIAGSWEGEFGTESTQTQLDTDIYISNAVVFFYPMEALLKISHLKT